MRKYILKHTEMTNTFDTKIILHNYISYLSCDEDERHGVQIHMGLFQRRYNGTYVQGRGH